MSQRVFAPPPSQMFVSPLESDFTLPGWFSGSHPNVVNPRKHLSDRKMEKQGITWDLSFHYTLYIYSDIIVMHFTFEPNLNVLQYWKYKQHPTTEINTDNIKMNNLLH